VSVFQKYLIVFSVCLVSFLFSNFIFAAAEISQTSAKNAAISKEHGQFFFAASANEATIKPVSDKLDQIVFHNMRDVAFLSYQPKLAVGNIKIEIFAEKAWAGNSEVNMAVSASNTRKSCSCIHFFRTSHPRYNATTKDLVVDVIPVGNKDVPTFKAKKEITMHNVKVLMIMENPL